jgi:hypothetical protein
MFLYLQRVLAMYAMVYFVNTPLLGYNGQPVLPISSIKRAVYFINLYTENHIAALFVNLNRTPRSYLISKRSPFRFWTRKPATPMSFQSYSKLHKNTCPNSSFK